jgi:hypothetical protein
VIVNREDKGTHLFKCFVEFFGSFLGRIVAEQGILIAALVGLESFSCQSMLDQLAFLRVEVSTKGNLHCSFTEESYPAIDPRRNWCHVFRVVEDSFDVFLQIRVQITSFLYIK